jgi:hypothetical protein
MPAHDDIERRFIRAFAQRDDVLLAFGKAMMAWSSLEGLISDWFTILTGMDRTIARQIFYAGRSFNARIDIFAAALPRGGPPTLRTIYLREAIKKSKQYASFRNMIAHGDAGVIPIPAARDSAGVFESATV